MKKSTRRQNLLQWVRVIGSVATGFKTAKASAKTFGANMKKGLKNCIPKGPPEGVNADHDKHRYDEPKGGDE